MTEEEYIRMKNLLDAVIEQQARAEARQTKTDEQIVRNTEGIAALLAITQLHDDEITTISRETAETFKDVAERFKDVAERFKDTDERINMLIDVVERYITKG